MPFLGANSSLDPAKSIGAVAWKVILYVLEWNSEWLESVQNIATRIFVKSLLCGGK